MDVTIATYRPIGITHDIGSPCDPDALAFITAHETSTGLSMDTIQKNAICGFVERLKGIGTGNSSNLWSAMVAKGSFLYPMCPINDSTANASAYAMDLISATSIGSFVNYLAGDITPTGVKGRGGAAFRSTFIPSNFSTTDIGAGVYSRTNASSSEYDFGIWQTTTRKFFSRLQQGFSALASVNSNTTSVASVTDSAGLKMIQRLDGSNQEFVSNGVIQSFAAPLGLIPTIPMWFQDINGFATATNTREMAMYLAAVPRFNANESADLAEAVQWYQANVITGGRETPYVDANALSFINAHEIATGSPMGAIQQSAVIGFVERLKGIGTVNNTNIWTSMVANGSTLFPLCPIDDSTANASAYNMELISASTVGTYTNFLPGDFTPQGVIGGSTKSFDTGIASNAYPVDNFGYGFYSRSNTAANSHIDVGSTSDGFAQVRTAAGQFGGRVNNAVDPGPVASPNSLGLFQMQAGAPNLIDKVKNGVAVLSSTQTHSTNTVPYTFHKYISSYSPRQLSMYILGMPYLSANGLADFYEAVQWYQTNVITTGRNV